MCKCIAVGTVGHANLSITWIHGTQIELAVCRLEGFLSRFFPPSFRPPGRRHQTWHLCVHPAGPRARQVAENSDRGCPCVSVSLYVLLSNLCLQVCVDDVDLDAELDKRPGFGFEKCNDSPRVGSSADSSKSPGAQKGISLQTLSPDDSIDFHPCE